MLQIVICVLSVLLAFALYLIYKMSMRPVQQCAQVPNGGSSAQAVIMGPHSSHAQNLSKAVEARDRAVLTDVLYPPTTRDTHANTVRLLQEPRLIPDPLEQHDQYQLIGYLINQTDKDDVWKLLARSRGRSQADFYAQSSNKNVDVKIPLTHEIARSADGSNVRPFRDIYDLPEAVILDSPMFSKNSVYNILQLPRSQLASGYL